MKILAIETSALSASAALCEDGFLLGEFYVNIRQTHSETLMPCVCEVLRRVRVGFGDIDLYAVTSGPGSFTGVRIGVSAVKGMAIARHVPCAAVSSLEAAAANLPFYDGIVCAVMDARRSQVYSALFDTSGGDPVRLTPDGALGIRQLGEELVRRKKKTVLVGDGAELCYNMLKELVPQVVCAPERQRFPHAAAVAALGYRDFLAGKTIPPEALAPLYLRLPQAERELKERLSSGTTEEKQQ